MVPDRLLEIPGTPDILASLDENSVRGSMMGWTIQAMTGFPFSYSLVEGGEGGNRSHPPRNTQPQANRGNCEIRAGRSSSKVGTRHSLGHKIDPTEITNSRQIVGPGYTGLSIAELRGPITNDFVNLKKNHLKIARMRPPRPTITIVGVNA